MDGVTVLGTGTVESVDNGKIIIDGKSTGFELPPETTGKQITANGDAKLDTSVKKFGQASLLLDGIGDSASVSTTADFGFGTGDFTVEFWAYPTQLQSTTLFDFRNNQSIEYALMLYLTNNGPKLYVNGSNIITGTQGFNLNTWTHCSIVRQGSTITM